ncbi:hypothetical protein FQZ97_633900 [compost metagenome]
MSLAIYGGPCEGGASPPVLWCAGIPHLAWSATLKQQGSGGGSPIPGRSLHRSHDYFVPTVFHRHHRALRALLIDDQAWVVARDLGPLTNCHVDERLTRKLDPDQWRYERLENHQGEVGQELLFSESAVCELLRVNFYHPEHRGLRQ